MAITTASVATPPSPPYFADSKLMHAINPIPSTTEHRNAPLSYPDRSSHIRRSSLTLFKIAATAGGNRLAPHSPISPPRGSTENQGSTTPSSPSHPRRLNGERQQQPESSSPAARRFSFAFGASGRGPAAGAGNHGRREEEPHQISRAALSPDPDTEAVRCHVVADDDILLPFIERAVEVRDLLFNSPQNATLASRLRSWASIRGFIGDDVLHTLTNVDRSELDDARWVATLRSGLIKEVPDLWADLALALGADGSIFAVHDPQVKSYEHREWYDDDTIDDASDLSSLAPLPNQGGSRTRKHSRSLSTFSTFSYEGSDRSGEHVDSEQQASSIEVEGLRYLPAGYSKAISQLQEPSFASCSEEEETPLDRAMGGHVDTPMPGMLAAQKAMKHPGHIHGVSNDCATQSARIGQGRPRAMSVSLTAQQPLADFDGDSKLASQSFAGLRLQANSRSAKNEVGNPTVGKEDSCSPLVNVSKAVRIEDQLLTVQHDRRMSDLVGGQQSMSSSKWFGPSSVNMPAQPLALGAPSIEPSRKLLNTIRPAAMSPCLDDEELLHPQKSKFGFARDFKGPTPSDPRHHSRPKAYSMTQYSSHVEQDRLEEGRIASMTPYEAAAEYEASGVDKPSDLGVLKDGRTRHPSSGKAESASVVQAFRISLGLSPGSTSLSPINSNPNSGNGSPDNGGSGTATPVPKDSLTISSIVEPASSLQNSAASDETAISSRSYDISRAKGKGDGEVSTAPVSERKSIQAALSTPPPVHRRPGGFGSFSAELEALQRSRARSDAAFSSGSQAVASSSEGSALSELGASATAEEEGEGRTQPSAPSGAPSSLRGTVSYGDLGMDFGDQQEENVDEKFDTPRLSAAFPSTPPRNKSASGASPHTSSPRSPRSVRGDDHIIIPIPPGGPRSRAQAMVALWKRRDIQYLVEKIKSTIGQDEWDRALEVMCTLERDNSTDLALLERLATTCFGLLDLDCVDEEGREEAERMMCGDVNEEEQDKYSRRWKAFELLLSDGLCVPSSTLQEAKRRCALHL